MSAEGTDILKTFLVKGAERVRLTYVDRAVVKNYFDETEEPVGEVLRPVLVVAGVHARLSNITLHAPYKWIKREEFLYKGETVIHEAGATTKSAMKFWCELREQDPTLFEHVVVMQQPAAVRDEVQASCN